MPTDLAFGRVSQIRNGLWAAEISPQEVKRLTNVERSLGNPTVILVASPRYDSGSAELRVGFDDLRVLNVGRSSQAILIELLAADRSESPKLESDAKPRNDQQIVEFVGHGDDAVFVECLGEVSERVRTAGIAILKSIRANWRGELQKTSKRKFVERPDNFWAVEVQVRKDALKFTVREIPKNLQGMGLEVWMDRPPSYSAFKVRSPDDVPHALNIIRRARRKFE